MSKKMIPTAKANDRASQLSESALELEKDAQKNVAAIIRAAKEEGLAVVRYDARLKKCYLEYPDGSRDYNCGKLKTEEL